MIALIGLTILATGTAIAAGQLVRQPAPVRVREAPRR